jgi:AbrB family looped-hinge helix DNA binding protein
MTTATTKLSTKGQLVIPAEVRKRLGWKKDDEIQVQLAEGGRLVLLKVQHKKAGWEALGGSLKAGRSLTKWLEEERAAERAREDRKRRSSSTRGRS